MLISVQNLCIATSLTGQLIFLKCHLHYFGMISFCLLFPKTSQKINNEINIVINEHFQLPNLKKLIYFSSFSLHYNFICHSTSIAKLDHPFLLWVCRRFWFWIIITRFLFKVYSIVPDKTNRKSLNFIIKKIPNCSLWPFLQGKAKHWHKTKPPMYLLNSIMRPSTNKRRQQKP